MKRAGATFFMLAFCSLTVCLVGVQAQLVTGTAAARNAQTTPSTSLTITIDGHATMLSLADLNAMPQKMISVHNEHTKADETYTGVLLGDLLAKLGLPVEKTTHRKLIHSYLIAEGTDKYWVLYSVTEIEPTEHNAHVIVATSFNGKPIGQEGALKLIDDSDKTPQRWVRNLSTITLKNAD